MKCAMGAATLTATTMVTKTSVNRHIHTNGWIVELLATAWMAPIYLLAPIPPR
jgi:hypothetical protein